MPDTQDTPKVSLPKRWPETVKSAVLHVIGLARYATAFFGRTIAKAKKTPNYIVCDRGAQFDCEGFRTWCERKRIKPPRYGAIGKHGSIAVAERIILTLKCLLRCLLLIPYGRETFQRELDAIMQWYNAHRPHTWLGGRTPDEAYHGAYAANRKPRLEPRPRWPRGSPCALPWALVRGSPGARVELEVKFHKSKKHLPIVTLHAARGGAADRSPAAPPPRADTAQLLFLLVGGSFVPIRCQAIATLRHSSPLLAGCKASLDQHTGYVDSLD